MNRLFRALGARAAVCGVLLSGFIGFPNRAEADTTTPAGTKLQNAAPEATVLANGGFALDFRIWAPVGHGDPKSLTVTYQWGGDGSHTLNAQRQNDRWHVEFPDQPKPNDQASVKLQYAFALSDDDRTKIQKAAQDVTQAVLTAVNQAGIKANAASTPLAPTSPASTAGADGATASPATAPPPPSPDPTARTVAFKAAFIEASRTIATQESANTLRGYGTSTGQDGLSAVLDQLGVTPAADGASWSLTDDAAKRLPPAAAIWLQARVADESATYAAKLATVTATTDEQACSAAIGQGTPDEAHGRAALPKCAGTLQALAVKQASKDAAAAATLQKDAEANPLSFPDIGGDIDALTDPKLMSSYSYWAVRLARSVSMKATAGSAQLAKVNELLKDVDVAFENGSRIEDGSTLVESAAQPRRYDVATGFVFVAGIQDIVVPTLISICPAEGCLKANDIAWRAKHGWWRAVSFDAGVRVKTLDTQDRRQSDKLSFLTGVSYNPVTVLRVSGGLYWFENAQTQNWTGQPYVGVTLNVLNAAEILGSLGLGQKVPPTTTDPTTSAK